MKNKGIIMNWILLIAWMILIFAMSNQPADISNKQSDLFINILAFIGIDLNSALGSIASFIVRKAAHFTEYFILYWLAVSVFKNYIETNWSQGHMPLDMLEHLLQFLLKTKRLLELIYVENARAGCLFLNT